MEIEIFIDEKEKKIWITSKFEVNIRVDVTNLDTGDLIYSDNLNTSPEYKIWISPPDGIGYKSPWRSGMVITIYSKENFVRQYIHNPIEGKKKILYVASHLSTGGMPQYLVKQIESFIDQYSIYCVEFSQITGGVYVVQRNKIINLLGNRRFFALGDDKTELLRIIDEINPEIIHLQEFSEDFLPNNVAKGIYEREDRKYYIIETTHSSYSEPESKEFIPDRYIFASKYSLEKFKNFDPETEMGIWEYPIEIRERPSRSESLIKIGLDPSKTHVLNVGLFTPGKNQEEAFKIAENFGPDVQFHFIGNQAVNFQSYWEPIMRKKPDNCFVWGEKENVDDYMSSCDIFLFTSILELNPLVIKEALSWRMPIMMFNLYTYSGSYNNEPLVNFMSSDLEYNVSLLKDLIERSKDVKKRKMSLYHIVNNQDGEIEKNSINELINLCGDDIKYELRVFPLSQEIEEPPLVFQFQTMDSFKPGHWGCFKSFKSCILEGLKNDDDFIIICERDCHLLYDRNYLMEKINEACDMMNKHDIDIFSLGDTRDLDHGYIQSGFIKELGGSAFITDKIIGLQFQIFSRKGIMFLSDCFSEIPWNGMDIWLNHVYIQNPSRKRAIFRERLTTQFNGVSTIDGNYKFFL